MFPILLSSSKRDHVSVPFCTCSFFALLVLLPTPVRTSFRVPQELIPPWSLPSLYVWVKDGVGSRWTQHPTCQRGVLSTEGSWESYTGINLYPRNVYSNYIATSTLTRSTPARESG